jgi:hypothetical protein
MRFLGRFQLYIPKSQIEGAWLIRLEHEYVSPSPRALKEKDL